LRRSSSGWGSDPAHSITGSLAATLPASIRRIMESQPPAHRLKRSRLARRPVRAVRRKSSTFNNGRFEAGGRTRQVAPPLPSFPPERGPADVQSPTARGHWRLQREPADLIPILQRSGGVRLPSQDSVGGISRWLKSQKTNHGVATFTRSSVSKPEHPIRVCLGTACHVKGRADPRGAQTPA
jgi:hypothetical protein